MLKYCRLVLQGWEQSGEMCVRSVPVKAITQTEVSFADVEPIRSCPSGFSEFFVELFCLILSWYRLL